MRRTLLSLALILLLLGSSLPAHAEAQPRLAVALSTDRPDPGQDIAATIGVFDATGDVAIAVTLPAGLELASAAPIVVHAQPVGLIVVRIHVRADAAVGARTIVFRGGGQTVTKQIYVGTFPWPAAQRPGRLWLPLIRR